MPLCTGVFILIMWLIVCALSWRPTTISGLNGLVHNRYSNAFLIYICIVKLSIILSNCRHFLVSPYCQVTNSNNLYVKCSWGNLHTVFCNDICLPIICLTCNLFNYSHCYLNTFLRLKTNFWCGLIDGQELDVKRTIIEFIWLFH